MVVLSVNRINPQPLTAVRVSMGEGGAVAGLIANLLAAVSMIGYETQSATGPKFPGGWRLKFSYPDDPDQFAYPDDWILVTDSAYSDTSGWSLKPTSRVVVYGQSSGLAGTAADFVSTFTADTPLVFATTAPAVAINGNTATLHWDAPTSANGPFTYQVVDGSGAAYDAVADGTSATVSGLPAGDHQFKVTVAADRYPGVSGETALTDPITVP